VAVAGLFVARSMVRKTGYIWRIGVYPVVDPLCDLGLLTPYASSLAASRRR